MLKAYPAPSVVQTGLSISPRVNSSAAYEASWKVLSELLRQLSDLMDAGLAGVLVVQGNHKAVVTVSQGLYAYNESKAAAEKLVQTTINRISTVSGNDSSNLSVVAPNSIAYPTYSLFFAALNAGGSNQAGTYSMPSSHLLGRRELSGINRDSLISYLKRMLTNNDADKSGMPVFGLQGGPGPAKTPKNIRGALLPA